MMRRDIRRPRRLDGFTDELTKRQFDEFHLFAEESQKGQQGSGSIRQSVNGEQRWTENPNALQRLLVYQPDEGIWAPRSNRSRPLDTEYNPNALWPLDEQFLTDATTNGLDLTVESGTEKWSFVTSTMGGFRFDGSTVLVVAGASTLLGLTGDMTVMGFGILQPPAAGSSLIIGYDDPDADADPANNTLWSLFYTSTGAITFTSESGAGVNFDYTVNSYAAPHQFCSFGFTRSAGVVQLYLNGRVWGDPSTASTTPTGGGNSRLRIGGRQGAVSTLTGVISSVGIWPRAFTEEEMVERWNYCVGVSHGFIAVREIT